MALEKTPQFGDEAMLDANSFEVDYKPCQLLKLNPLQAMDASLPTWSHTVSNHYSLQPGPYLRHCDIHICKLEMLLFEDPLIINFVGPKPCMGFLIPWLSQLNVELQSVFFQT